ncbi:MAG: hypothetical protein IT578_10010 [Verrucomicrobiae bacterium]|nr:hypothetical protein [Verrucomicrobiae bacterium]
MPLGIVIALPNEWGYLGPAFHARTGGTIMGKRTFVGRLGATPVVAMVGGVGKVNARRASAQLCDTHGATALLSIGYAGALDPELRRGDLVLSAYSLNGLNEAPSVGDMEREERLRGVADASHEHHVYVGPLYTADRIVARHEEKSALFSRSGCPVVDMESYAVYSEARARNLPFLGIHTITDTAEEDIPALEVINPFLMSESPWRYPRLLFHVLKRPKLFWDMAMLSRDAKIAGRSAAHFLMSNQKHLAELAREMRALGASAKTPPVKLSGAPLPVAPPA